MKTNLNNKKESKSIMNRFYLFLITITILLSSSYASQINLINWQFEDGTGSIVTDLSPEPKYNGVLSNGANFETTNVRFGFHDVDFDGGNDVIQTTIQNRFYEEGGNNDIDYSISLWFRPDDFAQQTLFHYYGINDLSTTELRMHPTDVNSRVLRYKDEFQNFQEVVLSSTPDYSTGEYHHIVLNINPVNDEVQVYFNNVDVGTYAITNYAPYEQTYTLRLGADRNLNNDYDGDMDSFRTFNFLLNQSQVADLYNNNNIVLSNPQIEEEEQEQEITNINEVSIITIENYVNQNNNSLMQKENFNVQTSQESTCELYIDNSYYAESKDSVSHVFNNKLNIGQYEAFTYCYYEQDNEKFYQLSNTSNINIISNPSGEITFNINALDFNQEQYALYVVTPCLEPGIVIPGITQKYGSNANPNGAYFQRVQNGQASFNLVEDKYEFCLINGQISYDRNDYTNNYNANEVFNQINLGEFDLPSNITSTYTLNVEQFDIFGKTNPKAWGTSWVAIISGLIALFLGVLIVIVGVTQKIPQAIVFGGIMTLFALGYQVSNLLFLVGV